MHEAVADVWTKHHATRALPAKIPGLQGGRVHFSVQNLLRSAPIETVSQFVAASVTVYWMFSTRSLPICVDPGRCLRILPGNRDRNSAMVIDELEKQVKNCHLQTPSPSATPATARSPAQRSRQSPGPVSR